MKWFIIILTIADGNHPKFHASAMPSFEICQEAVNASKVQSSEQSEHGTAVAIYCASEPPSRSMWTYNGQLWFSEPKNAD